MDSVLRLFSFCGVESLRILNPYLTQQALLQQQQSLRFITIQEQNATYYLAPLYYNNEDIYHFDITVVIDKQTPAITFTFTKTLYVE